MNSKEFSERIVKLLNLTTSSSDHEALMAIRKVNQIRTRKGLSWNELIDKSGSKPWLDMDTAECMTKVNVFLKVSGIRLQHSYMEKILEALAFRRQEGYFRDNDKQIIYEAYEKTICN